MTHEQLQKALNTHRYMQFIIEREQIRRAHGQTNDNVPIVKNEDTSSQPESGQPDDGMVTHPAVS